jgi:hypothetical protein
MRNFLIILSFLLLSSCGTYNLVTLEPTYRRPTNILVEPPQWYDYWFYNRGIFPYYIPPRVIVVEPQRRNRPYRVSTPNRGRLNQSSVRRPSYNRGTPPPTPSNRNSAVRRSNNNVRKQN